MDVTSDFTLSPSRWQPAVIEGYPDPRDGQIAYDRWWDEEIRRCVQGYEIGNDRITGLFYFYLNHWTIKGEDGFQHPWYTDLDHEFFEEFRLSVVNSQDLIVLKARDKGFSYKGGVISGYPLLFKPGGVSLIGGYLQDYADDVLLKFWEGFNHLHREFKINMLRNSNSGNLRIETGYQAFEDGIWQTEGMMSYGYTVSYLKGEKAAIGKRCDVVWYEESPHNPHLLKLYIKDLPLVKRGAKKFGPRVFGGTAGKFSDESRPFMTMYHNAETYNCRKFFIPGWKFYMPFINPDGTSQEKEATESILADRTRLKKDKSPDGRQAYWDFVREVCLTEDEAMALSGANNFDLEKLNSQRAKIIKDKKIEKRIHHGYLDWEMIAGRKTGKVVWRQDPSGPIKILYHPREGFSLRNPLDIAGIDSYDQEKAETSDSQGAMVVYRRYVSPDIPYDLPVCMYMDRPADENLFYENCLKICIYYNCKALVEYTKIGILNYFKNHNMTMYLKERPLSADVMGSKMTNRFGIHMMEPQKIMLRGALKTYIDHYCDHIWFMELLDELIKFGMKNTDLAMAFGIALLYNNDILRFPVSKQKESSMASNSRMPRRIEKNGQIHIVSESEYQEFINGVKSIKR